MDPRRFNGIYAINGFSIKEIAKIQEVSEGLVKVNLSRGRKELKDLMEDQPKFASSNNARL